MKKLLILSLLFLFLFSPVVLAITQDINISVNVTSAPPIPPMRPTGYLVFGSLFGIVIASGGLLFLLQTLFIDVDPKTKIELLVAGVVIIYIVVVAVGLI